MIFRILLPIALTGVMLFACMTSCTKEDPDSVAERNRQEILDYLKSNDLMEDVIEDPSGIFYIVTNEGTGANPTLTNPIRIKYVGYYTDGNIFDASEGAMIVLQSTIPGWRVGIPKFRNGGQGKLLIPSSMGYGSYPPWGSGIRRNAVLIFDFTIVDIS